MTWFATRKFGRVMSSMVVVIAMALIAGQAPGQCNEQAKLFPSDGELDDWFGFSVSISGAPGNEIAIVGSPSHADNGANSGSAYIYRKSGGIWVEEAKLLASDGAVGDSFGRSVSISGAPGSEVAIVGAENDNHSGRNENGSAYIYRFNGAVWVEELKLLASDTAPFDSFGDSVSIISTPGNEVVIVGAPGDGDSGLAAGSAYVFRFNGVTWVEEQKLLASDGVDFDNFGRAIMVSGASGNEVAIIGAQHDDDNGLSSGSAYIFRFNGATWDEEDKLIASDGAADDLFGISVSISGAAGNEVAIIGAPNHADNAALSGAAYVYRFNGATWGEEQKLLASDGAFNDFFGWSVSISSVPGNEVVIVGAIIDNDNGAASGSAYIYRFNGAIWVEESKLLASDGTESDQFGFSVSIIGDTAIVGARQNFANCTDSGSAYIFELPCGPPPAVCPADTNCSVENEIFASDGAFGDSFGVSVSISGSPGNEVVIVGARGDDDFGSFTGSAYVFRRSGASWIEQTKLLASDAAAAQFFGVSVSISSTPGSEVAIVGAPFDNHNGSTAGAAYIYRFNGLIWVEEQKITASDGAVSDLFGWSVSIGGSPGNEVAIVGAYQDDDNGAESGSAYIYRFNGATWIEEDKLLATDGAADDWFGRPVRISGDSGNEVVIVGAINHSDNGPDSGSAYIYRYNGVTWDEEEKLLASDGEVGDSFGGSVSISGPAGNEFAIVGAAGDDDNCLGSGSAYIFRRSGGIWVLETKLLSSDGDVDDRFGGSVAIRNDVAFVGASGDDESASNSGSVYIFRFNSATWEEEAKILLTDPETNHRFGSPLSISGTSGNEVAISGTSTDSDLDNGAGSAYILELPCALPVCPADTNCSGDVNVTDLLTLLGSWGPCPAPCVADSNSDGDVNVTDLLILLGAWGPCP